MKVRLDVFKPLRQELRVFILELGREISFILQYEHLPEFCYGCGVIGHRAQECPIEMSVVELNRTPKKQ